MNSNSSVSLGSRGDPLLELLVKAELEASWESKSHNIWLELAIGGTNLCGKLIGGKAYLDIISEKLSVPKDTFNFPEDNDPTVAPRYIHLLTQEGRLWRIRLSVIDGFSLITA